MFLHDYLLVCEISKVRVQYRAYYFMMFWFSTRRLGEGHSRWHIGTSEAATCVTGSREPTRGQHCEPNQGQERCSSPARGRREEMGHGWVQVNHLVHRFLMSRAGPRFTKCYKIGDIITICRKIFCETGPWIWKIHWGCIYQAILCKWWRTFYEENLVFTKIKKIKKS